ncbi:MAG: T9SS type A sorting domain-containing protein [Bacteroidales bacterium]|nr:T9SS type A sorting domain-containing protein [Bacteroidales bacterium]
MKTIAKAIFIMLLGSMTTSVFSQNNLVGFELNVNNVNALFHPVGNQFWDLMGQSKFEVPSGEGTKSIFCNTLWIGGLDLNQQLKIAAEKYRMDGEDFFPGPLTVDGTAEISPEVVEEWNWIWPISRVAVDEFLIRYNNPEYPDYVIPDQLLDWPGNGGANLAHNLAPYIDVNDDDIYNPEDGDYPDFPGDMALFFIFNDKADIHTETGGASIGIEVHALAYAFACSESEAFNNTVFLNYDIINRSTNLLTDVYVGLFTDFDIGGASDDYIGCDVGRGCYYGYNGDDVDGSGDGTLGYGEFPPAQATVFLAGPLADPDGYDNVSSFDTVENELVLNCEHGDILNGNINGLNFNDGIMDNERLGMTGFISVGCIGNTATLEPHTAIEYYNYMRTTWLDGTPLCYGGTGHQMGGGDIETPTKFQYPGSPTSDPCGWGTAGVPQEDWSEVTVGTTPGDRKGLGITGPFTYAPNDTLELDIAFVYGRSYNPELSSVELMLQYVDEIRDGYLANTTPCGIFQPNKVNSLKVFDSFNVQIYPNPANSNLTVEINSNANTETSVKIMDVNGRVFVSESFNITNGQNRFVMDINTLSAGIYIVTVNNGIEKTNKKLVVL